MVNGPWDGNQSAVTELLITAVPIVVRLSSGDVTCQALSPIALVSNTLNVPSRMRIAEASVSDPSIDFVCDDASNMFISKDDHPWGICTLCRLAVSKGYSR